MFMWKSFFKYIKKCLFGATKPWEEIFRPFLSNRSCVVVDIGAANGLLPHWSKLDNGCKIVFIEPHKESLDSLRKIYEGHLYKDNFYFVKDAISSVVSKRILFKSKVPTGTSILKIKENAAGLNYIEKSYLFPLEEVEIETKTLSQVLQDQKLREMHFLKIDIQGAEMEVIQGIQKSDFDALVLIEAEIGLVDTYEGQRFFFDFESCLRPHQFDVFDLRVARAHPCKNDDAELYARQYLGVSSRDPSVNARAWELDAVFIKNPDLYLKRKDKDALIRIVFAYCLYNGFTEALKCLDRMMEEEILNAKEVADFHYSIKAWHHRVKASHPALMISGSNFISRIFRKFGLDRSQNWARYMWIDHPNS